MELKIENSALPQKPEFNFAELKEGISAGIEKYEKYKNIVMDADAVKIGKSDRASLNHLKKSLNDERIRQEKVYMQPFNEFKAQINELIALIDEPIKLIDGAVKGYEENVKAEKEKKIMQMLSEVKIEGIDAKMFFNPKWLNSSVTLKKVAEEITARISQIHSDIETLENLPEFAFEALTEYRRTLDINRAIAEGKRLADIQKAKAEHEAKKDVPKETVKVEPMPEVQPVKPQKQWVSFRAHLSVPEARELKAFFDSRNIAFEAVKERG